MTYRILCRPGTTDIRRFDGAVVTLVRPLSVADADAEVLPMFQVRTDRGDLIDVWRDELVRS